MTQSSEQIYSINTQTSTEMKKLFKNNLIALNSLCYKINYLMKLWIRDLPWCVYMMCIYSYICRSECVCSHVHWHYISWNPRMCKTPWSCSACSTVEVNWIKPNMMRPARPEPPARGFILSTGGDSGDLNWRSGDSTGKISSKYRLNLYMRTGF